MCLLTKGVAVTRLGQLFIKNTGLCKVVRQCMGLTLAQRRKVKEVGDLITWESTTEAPVNGGRNYNGLKIAKFFVK